MTFLYRAPKINLQSLPLAQIALSYQSIFRMSDEESISFSKLTKGYALAFQILGDILFQTKKTKIDKALLSSYDAKLAEWSYEITWKELTEQEKRILTLLAHGKDGNKELIDALSVSKENLVIYKQKLAKEGLVDVSIRGKMRFFLPRFKDFVLFQEKLAEE